jgi:hypothetical protein
VTRKTLAKFIAGAIALGGSQLALACQTTNWTGGAQGAPLAGEPDDATPVSRYSGKCGLRSTASGSYVRDNSPAAEPKYRARFYAFTGVTGTGEAVVFRATRASDSAAMIRVTYDTGVDQFKFYVGPDATADGSVAAVEGRWYSIELNYSNAAPAELRYTVQGNASNTPVANNALATAAPTAADVIDTAELGWVASTGAPTGAVNVDAFDSRRTSPIGRLKRADSNNSQTCSAGDITATARDIIAILTSGNQGVLALGQPDCNENGTVSAGDITCTAQVIIGDLLSGTTVCGV